MSNNNQKKTNWLLWAGSAGLLIGIVVVYSIVQGFSHVTTDDAYIQGHIHNIASKVPGTVKNVHVDDNQLVKNGEVLLEIDPIDYGLKVNEAEANLEIRKASFEQAQRDKERAEALYKEGVFPKEKYEHALTAFDLAKAQGKAAREQFKIAVQNLQYTKIYSPAAGHITQKSVEIGNQIQAGQPLMAVVALDDLWIIANYKETQLKKVRFGQRVLIRVDTYPGKIFMGRVDSIMAGTGAVFSLFPPENALGNYVKVVQRVPVKIIFDKISDERFVLRMGMSCIPTIITRDEQDQ